VCCKHRFKNNIRLHKVVVNLSFGGGGAAFLARLCQKGVSLQLKV
jgi:hypothetical protein